jgi:hypothetical protein
MRVWGSRNGRWVNGGCLTARLVTQRTDGIQQFAAVPQRGAAKLPEVLGREIGQNRFVYLILAECNLILSEAEAPQPTVNVQVQSPGSCQRQFLIESWRPAGILAVFPSNLGFAMWTPTTRQQHSRPVTRYQTDLTEAEWRVIAPHLPKPCARGRPRAWPMREIIKGILYVMRARLSGA